MAARADGWVLFFSARRGGRPGCRAGWAGFHRPRWLLDASVLHHIQLVPAAQPDWTTAAWLTGLAILTAAAGTALFSRRDLAGT